MRGSAKIQLVENASLNWHYRRGTNISVREERGNLLLTTTSERVREEHQRQNLKEVGRKKTTGWKESVVRGGARKKANTIRNSGPRRT